MSYKNLVTSSELSPTIDLYQSLEAAFDHFNKELFDGLLPQCLLTLRSNNKIYGYHHSDRFITHNGDLLDELGLNPGYFALRPIEVTLSTLVHEMVHHWQSHFGESTPSNPHNAEWARKMEEIGLVPSNTGLPGGKQTGKSMTHFIHPEGRFIESCTRLLRTGYKVKWFDRHASTEHSLYEKQAIELKKHEIKVELSEPPIDEIEYPVQSRGRSIKPSEAISIYNPPPKKEYKRVRMRCRGCDRKVMLTSQIHIICGACNIDFEVIDSL